LKLTGKIAGQSVLQADLRKRFKLNIIALEQAGKTTTEITPELLLNKDDVMVVVGKKEDIKRLESYLL
jgi:trk system potassium uptake protein TrkA